MAKSKQRARAYSMEKEYERWSNGRRLGTLGKEDVISNCNIYVRADTLYIECKEQQNDKGLKKLFKWFEQAERYGKDGVPILAIHILHTKYDDDLIVIKRKDLQIGNKDV